MAGGSRGSAKRLDHCTPLAIPRVHGRPPPRCGLLSLAFDGEIFKVTSAHVTCLIP